LLRLAAIAGVVALPLIGVFCALSWVKRPSLPRVQLPPFALHLESDTPGSVVDARFKLTNVGGSPLDFTVTTSCGCTTVKPQSGVIAPGEAQEVELGVRIPDAFGGQRAVTVAIQSNDPLNPFARYLIQTECPAPFAVAPQAVHFGNVREGDRPKVQIVVKPTAGARGRLPETWSLSGSGFDVEEEHCSATELRIGAAPAASLGRGYYHAVVNFRARDGHTMPVVLDATICGGLSTAPAYLRLQNIRDAEIGRAS